MIRIFRNRCSFARMRARKDPDWGPRLKNLTHTQGSQIKIQALRKDFRTNPTQSLSSVLNTPKQKLKGKLGQRFDIDYPKLQKDIRHVLTANAKISKLKELKDGDLDFLHGSDSYMYDQQAEIQFQEEFKKRIFYKKEIARLLQKKNFEPKNHIAGKQDTEYIKYLQNKKRLKNCKIQNMMGFNRNNEQLQLLIKSGLIDDPNSFKEVIEKLENSGNQQKMLEKSGKSLETSLVVLQEELSPVSELSEVQEKRNSDKLRTISKLVETYSELNEQDRGKYQQQIGILYQIKKYENQLFNQRYQAINFRFKGQTDFTHMKEPEIRSYIKHVKIEPSQLLQIFKQNENRLNKFNYPIITPMAMATIYTKSSFYVFPEDDNNNRINMLNDRNFVALEKKTFKSIMQLDNSSFADTVWAYAKNHEEEVGILNPKIAEKVQKAIYIEMSQRAASLNEEDLGLCVRSLIKLSIINDPNIEWGQIVEVLRERLSSMKEYFEIQSVLNFVSLVPATADTVKIIRRNLNKLLEYKWEFSESLTTFLRLSSFLLNNHKNQPLESVKAKIRNIIEQKYRRKQFHELIPKYSVNSIAYFNSILLKSQTNIPSLIDMSKKFAIQNIKLQKQLLNKNTLPSLTLSFAHLDFWMAHGESSSCLKAIVPGRVHKFNSAKYFVYHQIAKLTVSEVQHLSDRALVDILVGCSLVQYKNESFYDTVIENLLVKHDMGSQLPRHRLLQLYFGIIHCFCLQKRVNGLFEEIRGKVFAMLENQTANILAKVTPNFYMNFFVDILSLERAHISGKERQILKEVLIKKIQPYLSFLGKSQLVGLFFMVSSYLDLNSQFRKDIIKVLSNNSKRLSLEELFTVRLVASQEEYNCINHSEVTLTYRFDNVERIYYEMRLDLMLSHEQHIGTEFTYTQIYSKYRKTIQAEYPYEKLVQLPWRIEVPDRKIVYYFVTYDHLMLKEEIKPEIKKGGKTLLRLFGVWNAYPEIYEKMGWETNVIYTFLQTSETLSDSVSDLGN